MKLGTYLKDLRKALGISQDSIGAQGFISTPGWIKLENGQRSPSEELIEKLTDWLVKERYRTRPVADNIKLDLFFLKYMEDPSPFVRFLANHTAHMRGSQHLEPSDFDAFVFAKKKPVKK